MAATAPAPHSPSSSTSSIVQLQGEHEWRYEAGDSTIKVILREGTAEMFGTELLINREYHFTSTKGAVFTWHGATLEVEGEPTVSYTATDTPMTTYLNLHTVLESHRVTAAENKTSGPKVMIVGPTDVGKSTVSKILLNYAVRLGHRPTYVDLDVGQGAITIPGMLAAVEVTQPVDAENGVGCVVNPLVYFYGHASPGENSKLFLESTRRLFTTLQERAENYAEYDVAAGMIINTCGWVKDEGLRILLECVKLASADVVVVIGDDLLHNELTKKIERIDDSPYVVKVAKSGGVVVRDSKYREATRFSKIDEYFHTLYGRVVPVYQKPIHFKDVFMYRVGLVNALSDVARASVLPMGAKSSISPTELVEVVPSLDLMHTIIAVSTSTSMAATLDSAVAGFLLVTSVDMVNGSMTVFAPSQGPLPSPILLVTSIRKPI